MGKRRRRRRRKERGTCWSAFYTHRGEIERKSVWLSRRRIYDLIRFDGWLLPSVWSFPDAFTRCLIFSKQRAHGNTLAPPRATDGQTCDLLHQQTRGMFIQILVGFPAAERNQRIDTASVHLTYELCSLLWRYLRASDQQFPGRHAESSDWSERARDGAAQRSGGFLQQGGGVCVCAESAVFRRPPPICSAACHFHCLPCGSCG